MGSKSSQTVGYKYYLGMHLVFSYGNIDEIQDIVVGDRSLKDNGNSSKFPITSSSRIKINSPELFGGESREGGVEGWMDVAFGESNQQINSYLDSQISGSVPAYRGVLSLILNGMHLTSNNPYIKPWMGLVKRTLKNHDGSTRWYSSKADISGQCNPAHIIYEVLTNSQWGMGYPINSINDANFKAAADQFHTEGFGLWIKWSSSSKIKDVISEVQRTTDCILYQDQSTGLFKIKLIRDDYDTEALIKFDESNIVSVDKFEHKGWGETINEVIVEYTDIAQRGKKAIAPPVQDLGNIQMQGSIIGTKKQYPAITTAALASRVAARDLRALSVPLTSLEITVNRDAWDLVIGDVFEFTWTKYGVESSYFRIAKIDKGTLSKGQIKIYAIEDIFNLPNTVYVKPQPPSWIIPNNPPEKVLKEKLFYVGFWDIARTLPQANINTLDPNFAGLITNAVVATSDTFNYRIYDTNSEEYTGSGPPSAFAQLFVEIDNKEQNIELMNGIRLSLITFDNKPYTYILVNAELMRIDSLTYDDSNPTFMQLTVGRGALDTVPVNHSVGEDVWFPSIFAGFETEQRVSGETASVKLLPRTSYGQLDPADATAKTLILNDRYQAPYPPGYLQIGSDGYLPDKVSAYSVATDIIFTVYHRNRVVDTAGIISQDQNVSSSVDNEDEQGNTRNIKYFITIINTATSDVLVNGDTMFDSAIDGEPTEVTYTYSNSGLLAQLTVEIWSQYYGLDNSVYGYTELDSWQTVTHTFLTPGGSMHALGGGPAPDDTGDHNYQSHL